MAGVALQAEGEVEGAPATDLPRVVFLGSPDCVCVVLKKMWEASKTGPAPFDLCAVVTQPPKFVSRKKSTVTKTPIHELAEEVGVRHIWTPATAKDEEFLSDLEGLAPDLCITAAYGQYLPKRFLRTPRLGTLNLHPSLLPRWRGASPVQRALVAGDTETGITILYTVTKMDAGPIAAQRSMTLEGTETSGQMLDHLFNWGSDLLVEEVLPKVFSGDMNMEAAQTQDEELVTLAPLIAKTDGMMWPHNETAQQMLNKMRGFDGWPGTTLPLAISGSAAPPQGFRVKVSEASVGKASELPEPADGGEERPLKELVFVKGRREQPDAVAVRSGADPEDVLLIRAFQLPGKKVVPARTFYKGYMVTQPARWIDPEEEADLAAESASAPKKKKRGRS